MEIPKKYDVWDEWFRPIGRNTINAGFVKKGSSPVDWSGGSFPLFSVSIVLRGKGVYYDSKKRSLPLEDGSVFFRIPHVAHTTLIDPESDWLEFFIAYHFMREPKAGEDCERFTGGNGFVELEQSRTGFLKLKNMPGQSDQWCSHMCRNMFGVTEDRGLVREIDLSLELLNACHEYLTLLKTSEDVEQLPFKGMELIVRILGCQRQTQTNHLVDQVKKLIRDNIASHKRIPEILKPIPLSYSSLRKRFLQSAGCGIGQFQIQCRMEQAMHYLQQGMSVKEVSSALGYKDPFFFSKQFHQQLGYAPSVISRRQG